MYANQIIQPSVLIMLLAVNEFVYIVYVFIPVDVQGF